jgi:hypothetical protein
MATGGASTVAMNSPEDGAPPDSGTTEGGIGDRESTEERRTLGSEQMNSSASDIFPSSSTLHEERSVRGERADTQEQPAHEPMKGGKTEILLTVGVIVIPLSIISAVLLGVVFLRRIEYPETSSTGLDSNTGTNEAGVYYVRVSSTTLVLLASFSSSVSTILISFFMLLISYPISKRILRSSELRNTDNLPTSYQFGLLIASLYGIGAFWQWTKYTLGWTHRSKMVGIVKGSLCGLVIATTFMYFPHPF